VFLQHLDDLFFAVVATGINYLPKMQCHGILDSVAIRQMDLESGKKLVSGNKVT
jgi:hypothetical protein